MQDSRGGPDFCHGLQFDWLLLFGGLNDTCPHLTKNSRCVQRLPPKSCDLADCGLVAPPPHTAFLPRQSGPTPEKVLLLFLPCPQQGAPLSPPQAPQQRTSRFCLHPNGAHGCKCHLGRHLHCQNCIPLAGVGVAGRKAKWSPSAMYVAIVQAGEPHPSGAAEQSSPGPDVCWGGDTGLGW